MEPKIDHVKALSHPLRLNRCMQFHPTTPTFASTCPTSRPHFLPREEQNLLLITSCMALNLDPIQYVCSLPLPHRRMHPSIAPRMRIHTQKVDKFAISHAPHPTRQVQQQGRRQARVDDFNDTRTFNFLAIASDFPPPPLRSCTGRAWYDDTHTDVHTCTHARKSRRSKPLEKAPSNDRAYVQRNLLFHVHRVTHSMQRQRTPKKRNPSPLQRPG